MLFDFTKKPAPPVFSVTAKPFGNVATWSEVADDLHSFYRLYRYESEADADADVNGEVAAETPRLKVRDDDGLSIGQAYGYRVVSVDTYGNESLKSAVDTAVAKLVTDDDVDLTGTIGDVSTEIGAAVAAEAAARAAAVAAEAEARAARDVAVYQDLRAQSEVAAETASYLIEVAMIAADAQQTLRREVTTQANSDRATFAEQINQAVAANSALVSRTTTLEAETASLTATMQEIELAYVAADEALAQTIESLAVGTNTQFDPSVIWYFDADVEGWAGNGTPAVTDGYLIPAADGADPYVTSPAGLAINGGSYRQVRARAKRTGAPAWEGWLWWKGGGDTTWDSSRRMGVTEPAWDGAGFGEITVNVGWTGTIAQIRLDLTSASDASNLVALDWVSVGRPSPGASSAALTAEQAARISADAAQVGQITSLTGRMTSAESGITGAVGGLSALTGRVETTEGAITAQSARIDGVEADLDGKASVTALDTLAAEVMAFGGEGGVSSIGQATRTIRNELDLAASEAIEASVADFLARADLRAAEALATQGLNTRIDATDTSLSVVSESVTSLSTAVAGKASTSSVETLAGRVTVTEGGIDALNEAVTLLNAGLTGKASATALDTVTVRVSNAELGISSLSTAVTNLSSAVAGKASATALDTLTTEVSDVGGRLTGVADKLTELFAGDVAGDYASARVQFSAVAGPTGWARYAVKIKSASGATFVEAGLYLEVQISTGLSRIVMDANQYVFRNGGSVSGPPFAIVDGVVYLGSVNIQNAFLGSLQVGRSNIANGAINGVKIEDGTITAVKLSVSQLSAISATLGNVDISSANIGTLQVGGANISNGAIAARHVSSASISTDKLTVSDTTNLAENGDLSLGAVGWGNPADIILDAVNAYNGGDYVCRRSGSGSYTNRNNFVFPVRQGQVLYASCTVKAANTAAFSGLGVRVSFLNKSGAEVVAVNVDLVATHTGNVWTKVGNFITTPATAGIRKARVEFVVYDQAAGTVYWSDAQITRAAGVLIEDGSIAAPKINVANLRAISANLGNVDISEAAIGSLQVDRANIKDGAINAAKISVANLEAISANLGNVNIQNAILGTLTVGRPNIANGAVNGVKIEDGSIGAAKINVGQLSAISATLGNVDISAANIGTLQVQRANIADGAINAQKINVSKLSAISANMEDLTVERANIANLAINGQKIDADAISTVKIIDGAISAKDSITGISFNGKSDLTPPPQSLTIDNATQAPVFIWIDLTAELTAFAGSSELAPDKTIAVTITLIKNPSSTNYTIWRETLSVTDSSGNTTSSTRSAIYKVLVADMNPTASSTYQIKAVFSSSSGIGTSNETALVDGSIRFGYAKK